jgi:hypothetical protein
MGLHFAKMPNIVHDRGKICDTTPLPAETGRKTGVYSPPAPKAKRYFLFPFISGLDKGAYKMSRRTR